MRRGRGKPLVLVHGLGGSWHSWSPVLNALAGERELIVPDLPGFGDSPKLAGPTTIATLADALVAYFDENGLGAVDVVGTSMGARLVLELARRGRVGAVVALDPGGFWEGWERTFFATSVGLSVKLVRAIEPALPILTALPLGRTLLFAQFSARPWALSREVALTELATFIKTPVFDEVLGALANGPVQAGMPRGSATRPIVIGWGRQDRVCLPTQADRAIARFPDARLHWFETSGHFPQWDAPDETVRLVLETTA